MTDRRSNPHEAQVPGPASLWARPAAGSAVSAEAAKRLGQLAGVIEAEIVPRLLLALSTARGAHEAPKPTHVPDAADAIELARLLLAHDVSVALAFVEMLRQQGAARERLCLNLFAPAARQLGRLWEQRQCNFEQFELGMTRLQSVLRQAAP
jgi:hypothetical protein